MRIFYFFILSFFQLSLTNGYSQQVTLKNAVNEEQIFHIVQAGETKFGLSKKYNVSISQLELQNPHIVPMLKKGDELKIKAKSSNNNSLVEKKIENKSSQGSGNYLVQSGETLYGIARKFGISVTELIQMNKGKLGSVLLSGQTLNTPFENQQQQIDEINSTDYHVVLSGQTKFGLSKKYAISIKELERLNPHIVDMLRTGQRLTIPGYQSEKTQVSERKILESKPIVVEKLTEKPQPINDLLPKTEISTNSIKTVTYEVKSQETIYGLTKMTGLTTEKLIELNPELSEGLKAGMIIKIPEGRAVFATTVSVNKIDVGNGLISSLVVNQQKEITFLAPFTEDEFTGLIQSVEKNVEIKPSFDFYAGAKIAMDSLKKIGVVLKASVYKNLKTNSIEQEFLDLKNKSVEKNNAVVALPNSYYSEKLGTHLTTNNVPYILTNPADNKISSTGYVAVPTNFYLRKLVLDYLVSQKQNIVVISDPAKIESEKFIAENYPMVKFVTFNNNATFNSGAIKSVLQTNEKNFVVFNTNDTGLILSITTLLLKESKEYESQIALLEPKEMLKNEGVSDMRFRALKMIYPSQYNPIKLKEVENFKQKFSQKYGFKASQDAKNGFDVTFDILLRLFQNENFEIVAKNHKTEQIGLKFNYVESLNQGYFNESGFILQFDEESNDKIIN